MISFISWVNNEDLYQGFKDSVHFLCEFIKIGQEATSLAQAYNYGTALATGDILVYVHQDVRLQCDTFNELMERELLDPDIGFVGPIGSLIMTTGPWWRSRQDGRGIVIMPMSVGGTCDLGFYNGPARQLDGLLLATKHHFRFPEGKLPGIHFLDLWICAEAERKGYKNRIVTFDIWHLSNGGNLDTPEFRQNQKIFKEEFYKGLDF